MASTHPSFHCLSRPALISSKARRSLHVKAQSFRDEGRSMNIVDANLNVLRERIEEMKMKERLKRCCRRTDGWYYQSGYYDTHNKLKKDFMSSELLNLVGLVGGSIGLPVLVGTLFLYILSLVIHATQ